jgi:hypothetical protein
MGTEERTAKDQVTEVMGSAKDSAQQQAGEVVEKGRGVLRGQVDQRSTQAGQQATSLAETMRQTAFQLRAEGDPQKVRYADAADQGAERLERVGGYLTGADADQLLGAVEDTARKQPWLIAGAGLLIGIAAARFMKASSGERYARSQARWQPNGARAWSPAELPPIEPASGVIPGRTFE